MVMKTEIQRRCGILNGIENMYLWTMWCQYLCFFQFRASFKTVDRDSAVGITTCYGLDGPGIEFWGGGRDFPHLSRPVLGPTQPPIKWVPGLSRGVKRQGRGVDHPLPSRSEVKERVELYFYTLSRPSWLVIERTLPLPLPYQLQKQDRLTKTDED